MEVHGQQIRASEDISGSGMTHPCCDNPEMCRCRCLTCIQVRAELFNRKMLSAMHNYTDIQARITTIAREEAEKVVQERTAASS